VQEVELRKDGKAEPWAGQLGARLFRQLELPPGYRDILIVMTSHGSGLGNPSLAESLGRLLKARFPNAAVQLAGEVAGCYTPRVISELEEIAGCKLLNYQGGSRGVISDIVPESYGEFAPPKADVAIYIGWPSPYRSSTPYPLVNAKLHVHVPLHYAYRSGDLEGVVNQPSVVNVSPADPFAENSALVPDLDILSTRARVLEQGVPALLRLRMKISSELKNLGIQLPGGYLGTNWTAAYTHSPTALVRFANNVARAPAFKKDSVLFLFRGTRCDWSEWDRIKPGLGVKVVDIAPSLSKKPLLRKLWAALGAFNATQKKIGVVPALVTGDSSFVEALSAGVPAIHDGVDGPSQASGFRRMAEIFSGPLGYLGAKYNLGYVDASWKAMFRADPVELLIDWRREATRWLLQSDLSFLLYDHILAHSGKAHSIARHQVRSRAFQPTPTNLPLQDFCPPSCTDVGFFWELFNQRGANYYPSLIFSTGMKGREIVDAFLSWGLIDLSPEEYTIALTPKARERANEIIEVFLRHGVWTDLSQRPPIDPARIAICTDISEILRA
jgi:hypothetical protein